MNKNLRIFLMAAVASVIAISIAASVFAYSAFLNDFDHDLFYFNRGSVSATLGTVLPFAGAAVAVILGFIMRKKASFNAAPGTNPAVIFASLVTGIFILASAFIPGGVAGSVTTVKPALFIVISLLTGAYFILMPFIPAGIDSPKASVMTALSFAPALFAAMMLLEEYFRTGEPLNSPIHTANLTMYALLLLFFAEDIRFAIGKARPASYYACSLAALAFTVTAAVPKLILILTGAEGFSFNFMEWCIAAAISMFILARLSTLPAVLGEYKPKKDPKANDVPAAPDNNEI